MPQIVCSHYAADSCSTVSGDRALLSPTEDGGCVSVYVTAQACVCQKDVHSIYVCCLRIRSAYVCSMCVFDEEH